jgi:putative transposase
MNTSGSHTVFHHRYHIVWITKYRYKVLEGALRERIRRCAKNWVSRSYPAFCRENMSICSWKSPHILRSATSCDASRDGHRIGCRWSSRTYVNAIGGGIFGLAATSPPRAVTSRTMSYFSIFTSTNLPAPAGSYSVCSLQLRALPTIDKQCLLTCQSRLHRVSAMRGQRKLKGCPRAGIGRRPYPAAMGLDD